MAGGPPSRPAHAPPVALALLAVLAAGSAVLGALVLARAGSGLTSREVNVAGVPMTEVRAAGATSGRRPGVVVAHGFAGSARLMRPIADTAARRGDVALLLDLTGHGANTRRLSGAGEGGAATDRLAADLDAAVAHLRSLPDVDPGRIALVGHSMGAGAVTRYAVAHPDIVATVAISLGDADALGPDPARPRSLLLLVGAAEFAGFRDAAGEALRRAGGAPDRRLVVVPGVEHISVLFAGPTHREIAGWLPGPAEASGPPRPLTRLAGGGLVLLGFALGFAPLTAALLGRRDARRGAPRRITAGGHPAVRTVVGTLAAAVLATAVAAATAGVVVDLVPAAWFPLAVGAYQAVFLLIAGLLLAGFAAWRRARAPEPPGPGRAGPGSLTPARLGLAGALLAGYAAAAVAVPFHLGFTWALPVGARWWLLPVVTLGCAVFLLGAERVTAGRAGRHAAVLAITVVVLVGAAMTGLAPGFVLLVVPLFAVLLGWHAAWAAVLRRRAAPPWLVALVGAFLLGWPVATTLPLTG